MNNFQGFRERAKLKPWNDAPIVNERVALARLFWGAASEPAAQSM